MRSSSLSGMSAASGSGCGAGGRLVCGGWGCAAVSRRLARRSFPGLRRSAAPSPPSRPGADCVRTVRPPTAPGAVLSNQFTSGMMAALGLAGAAGQRRRCTLVRDGERRLRCGRRGDRKLRLVRGRHHRQARGASGAEAGSASASRRSNRSSSTASLAARAGSALCSSSGRAVRRVASSLRNSAAGSAAGRARTSVSKRASPASSVSVSAPRWRRAYSARNARPRALADSAAQKVWYSSSLGARPVVQARWRLRHFQTPKFAVYQSAA